MNKVRCAHCGSRFVPNPRIRNQRYCGRIECQRARKSSWQRRKLATDPDYQANKQDSQRAWRIRNPGYWQNWRLRHPEYVERNRMLQQERRGRLSRRANSSMECAPTTCVPFASLARNSSTLATVRLKTATLKPWSFMLRTRFCPMTARPMRPISHDASGILSPDFFEIVASAECAPIRPGQTLAPDPRWPWLCRRGRLSGARHAPIPV